MNPETLIQTEILNGLKRVGIWAFRVGVVKRRGKATSKANAGEDGTPDIWTEYGWMEVKVPGKPLREDQREWHARANRRGIRVGVVESLADAFRLACSWGWHSSNPLNVTQEIRKLG